MGHRWTIEENDLTDRFGSGGRGKSAVDWILIQRAEALDEPPNVDSTVSELRGSDS